MTYVTRRSNLRNGGRRVLTGSQIRGTMLAPQASGYTASSAANGSTTYIMAFVMQPPSTARIGYPLYPACSVQVRYRYGYDDSYGDISRLIASATLVRVGSNGLVTNVAPGVLGGGLFTSIEPTYEDEADDDEQVVGLASFPNITIHQAGDYHIRVTLIRMAFPGEPAVNLQSIDSAVISVY